MKSFAIIAAVAVAVAAQSTPEELAGQLPECALECIHKAGEEAGCEQGDYACECENQDAITSSATTCQMGLDESERCNSSDLAKALEVANEICAAVEAGEGDEESSTATDDEASATESDASASETDSATDAEETDDAEETESSTADPTSTDSGDGAEESGEGDSEDGDGDAEDGDDADSAAVKLGSFGWAGAVAALAAFAF